ncbi:MAG: hypothetical protein ACHQRO_18455, partial [Vicinamibacteria bacterium]
AGLHGPWLDRLGAFQTGPVTTRDLTIPGRRAHVGHGRPGAERQQDDDEKENGSFPGQSHAGVSGAG